MNGENFVNVADRLTRFTHHWLESLWLSSTSKEKNSQTSPFILSWAAFHKCRGLVASMSADCILLTIGMTFQYSRSTNSDPWSFFNLFRLQQLDGSPPYTPQTFPRVTAWIRGFSWHPSSLFSPFPSTANVLGAQTENSNNHSSVCLSTSSPWAYFLTIKPCVCFQNLNLMRFAHPSWPYDKPFTRKFLSLWFSYHKAGAPVRT